MTTALETLKQEVIANQNVIKEMNAVLAEVRACAMMLNGQAKEEAVVTWQPIKEVAAVVPTANKLATEVLTQLVKRVMKKGEAMTVGDIGVAVLKAGELEDVDIEQFVTQLRDEIVMPMVQNGTLKEIGEVGSRKYKKK